MKGIIAIFLFQICVLTAISQKTKTVTKEFSSTNQISERYCVLKSDKGIKHGEYISYFQATMDEYKQIKKGKIKLDDFTKQKGHFTIGKKVGEWVEYIKPSELKTKGNYDNDKKVGIWITSKEKGQVMEKYDYDNNQKLKPEISVVISYPSRARNKGIEGKVYVSFKTNKDCSLSDFSVIKSVSAECDKEAIDKLKKLGELNKKYGVDEDCEEKIDTFRVNFKLSEE